MKDNKFFTNVHVLIDSDFKDKDTDILSECSSTETETIDLSDIRTAFLEILERSRDEYLLIVTDNKAAIELIIGLNKVISGDENENGKFISLLSENTLYAEPAKTQMEEEYRAVHTADGKGYVPTIALLPNIFTDKKSNALIYICGDVNIEDFPHERIVYNIDNEVCGFVLSEELSSANLVGTLTDACLNDNEFATKLRIAKIIAEHATKTGRFVDFDSTLVFNTRNGTELFTSPEIVEKEFSAKECSYAIWNLFFGYDPIEKDKLALLFTEKHKHTDFPSAIFSFFEQAFVGSILPSLTKNKVTADRVMSALANIADCEKEEFVNHVEV